MTPTRLRECLALLRWSQRGLADAIGRDEGTVRMMARGTRPIPPTVAIWLETLAATHHLNQPPMLPPAQNRAAELIRQAANDPRAVPSVKQTLASRVIRQAAESGVEPRTADYIKSLAGRALEHPERLSEAEIRELAGSVLRHIEPRKPQADRQLPQA